MSPERAAIIDAMMLQGGGPQESAYSVPNLPPPQETWLERFQREKREFQDARVRAAQEGQYEQR